MKKEICRAFTLYNDKILSDFYIKNVLIRESKIQKDYISIGFFDWFNTKRIICNVYDEKETNSIDKLSELCNYTSKLAMESNGQQSYQNIFGFRIEDDKDAFVNDENFWNEENNTLPLKFISFFQFKEYSETLFLQIQQLVNTCIAEKKDKYKGIEHIVYLTLDKSDLIICIKSDSYKKVIDLINDLYIEFKQENIQIIYSYTNLVVNYDKLNNNIIYSNINTEEVIDSICIKTVLNNNSNFDICQKLRNFNNKLEKSLYGDSNNLHEMQTRKDLVCYEIIGDTDCRFIARDVTLEKILALFSQNEILNRNNNSFKYCFLSSMTSLNVSRNNCAQELNFDNLCACYIEKKKEEMVNSKTSVLIDKVKYLINDSNENDIRIICKILQILNCLSSMELSYCQKYEFESLFAPIETMIKLFTDNIHNKQLNHNMEELFSFIDSIYSVIQGAMRTDIRFYHILDYSVMTYYAPAKLRAFYSLLANNISEFYASLCPKDENLNYVFLILPSTTYNVSVEQVWKNAINEDKLMKVNIPENELYEPETSVFHIGHEVAHFVGNEKIRCREYRFYMIAKTLLYHYYKVLCRTIKECSETVKSEIIEKAYEGKYTFEILYNKKKEEIKNYFEELFLVYAEKEKLKDKNYCKYLQYINNILLNGFTEELSFYISGGLVDSIKCKTQELLDDNFGNCRVKEIQKQKNFWGNLDEEIKESTKLFLYESITAPYGFLNQVIDTVSESYADLSVIILLDLDANAYLTFVFNSLEQIEDYTKSTLFKRACLVIVALSMQSAAASNIITNSVSYFNLLNAQEYHLNGIEDKKISSIRDYCSGKIGCIKDWEYIQSYLEKCIESYCVQISKNAAALQNRDRIKKLYNDINENKLIKTVNSINEYVKEAVKQTEKDT